MSSRLSLTFEFHPPVLKPDFDLPFRQIQRRGDLNPSGSTQILVEVKLLFKFQQLRVSVGSAQAPTAGAPSDGGVISGSGDVDSGEVPGCSVLERRRAGVIET